MSAHRPMVPAAALAFDEDIDEIVETEGEDLAADPYAIDFAALRGFKPDPGRTRFDGWTPDKQRMFLQALAEGLTVSQACEVVDLSRQSAYALRTAPRGAAFALGWQAAVLIARNALTDTLMERAIEGQRETVTYDDGRIVTRQRFDNRLALAMLKRLDGMAEAGTSETSHTAARLVASDFDQFLDLIGRDAGPARAGLFLGARAQEARPDDLAPLRALARADTWLRTHTDLAEPLDAANLDPATRGDWTGEQWNRAEAVGLVALAPEPAPQPAPACQDCQLPAPQTAEPLADDPVWWCETAQEWRTRFPPPADFDGDEVGEYGDYGYERALSADEARFFQTADDALAERREADTAERDAYFAALSAEALRAPEECEDADEPTLATGGS